MCQVIDLYFERSKEEEISETFSADASCSFDTWYCGWENGPGSQGLTWTRKFGPTISHETGPSQDHTSGSGKESFIPRNVTE